MNVDIKQQVTVIVSKPYLEFVPRGCQRKSESHWLLSFMSCWICRYFLIKGVVQLHTSAGSRNDGNTTPDTFLLYLKGNPRFFSIGLKNFTWISTRFPPVLLLRMNEILLFPLFSLHFCRFVSTAILVNNPQMLRVLALMLLLLFCCDTLLFSLSGST